MDESLQRTREMLQLADRWHELGQRRPDIAQMCEDQRGLMRTCAVARHPDAVKLWDAMQQAVAQTLGGFGL